MLWYKQVAWNSSQHFKRKNQLFAELAKRNFHNFESSVALNFFILFWDIAEISYIAGKSLKIILQNNCSALLKAFKTFLVASAIFILGTLFYFAFLHCQMLVFFISLLFSLSTWEKLNDCVAIILFFQATLLRPCSAFDPQVTRWLWSSCLIIQTKIQTLDSRLIMSFKVSHYAV